MAANITLGSVAVDTTGKIVTATISGGTGTGFAITDDTEMYARVTGGAEEFAFVGASVGVVGTTLTLTLRNPIGQGETAKLFIGTGSNLTDSGANTPQGQSTISVTNNSTVTVRTLTPVTDASSFEYNGGFAFSPFRTSGIWVVPSAGGADWPVEFVTDATDICLLGYMGATTTVSVDAGAPATAPVGRGFWVAKPVSASPLSAGKHLIQFDFGDYFHGARIAGGTRTTYTVPTTKRTLGPTASGYVGVPSTTQVAVSGVNVLDANGQANCGSFGGFTFEFEYTGSGVEVCTVANTGNLWAVSNDGGQPGALVTPADADTDGGFTQMGVMAEGLASGTHQIHAMMVAPNTGTFHRLVKVINGTKTTTSAAINDTSLSVVSVAQIAVDDWVKVGKYGQREFRQVTAITGSGPYTLTLNDGLDKAHDAGVAVTSFSAAAGTISAYQRKAFTRRMACRGDSNTQGYNPLGVAGDPDALGNYYAFYDPRCFAGYLMGQPLGIDIINLGVQGEDSVAMAGNPAFATYAGDGYDVVSIWGGTNDINSNTTTPSQYKANVQTLITAAVPDLAVGGKILLMPPGTPVGVTSGKGLDIETCLAKLQELAAENPNVSVVTDDILDDLDPADIAALHYEASGQAKISNRLAKWVAGSRSLYLITGAGTEIPLAFDVI